MTGSIICMEIWTEWMGKGLLIDIICTDFAKAFDRVPSKIITKDQKQWNHWTNTSGDKSISNESISPSAS